MKDHRVIGPFPAEGESFLTFIFRGMFSWLGVVLVLLGGVLYWLISQTPFKTAYSDPPTRRPTKADAGPAATKGLAEAPTFRMRLALRERVRGGRQGPVRSTRPAAFRHGLIPPTPAWVASLAPT